MNDRSKKRLKKYVLYISLIFCALLYILPIMLLFSNSIKVNETELVKDLSTFRAFLPVGKLGLDNLVTVFSRLKIGHYFMNSMIITGSSVLLGLLVNSMLAYTLARLPLKGKRYIILFVISILIIPREAITVPLLLIVSKMGIIDTYIVQILPFIADAFSIFLFYQSFRTLPKELEESALIDGANYFTIFYRIALPVSKPTIITLAILTSNGIWGEVLWPTMVTRSSATRPLALGILQLFNTRPQMWGHIFASGLVMTLPIFIMFIIFQRQFVESMASSGIKG